jgi:hypothetical protein
MENAMKRLSLIVLLAVLAGCANSPTPHYDTRFGDAVRQARQMMTLNPNAGSTPPAVAGIDGKAAAEAVGRYQDSFKAPPPVTNVINIGGSVRGR